jgi:ADP-ribose pyrophosphatase YjhB (NUDIX family)
VDYYFHDPAAPAANSLVVGASAVVTDGEGRILLRRRADPGNWALPGDSMELGETLASCAIREVREETGFDVRIDRIVACRSTRRSAPASRTTSATRRRCFAKNPN